MGDTLEFYVETLPDPWALAQPPHPDASWAVPARELPLTADLIPHPTTPLSEIRRAAVAIARPVATQLELHYTLEGRVADLAVPPRLPVHRTDGLWRHTCFEAFVKQSASAAPYREYNFAPSGEWAAYEFTDYRAGMTPLETRAPSIAVEATDDRLMLRATIEVGEAVALSLALSCVIEARDGRLSYWALAHPGERPDFHHRSGFVLQA